MLSKKKKSENERGVIYFSSIPRNMRPAEIRLHFNKFGEIMRMKFIPFPKKERRPGGPLLPLQFKEGWIEFSRMEDAVKAAQSMNATPVECKRVRKCYGQLWTVKFLESFSFDDLADIREGERRLRRMEEVNAKKEERSINEAFRRAALQGSKRSIVRKKRERDSDEDGNLLSEKKKRL